MTKRVLVVDDETNLRFAIRLLLSNAGFDVVEAADGQQALDLLAARDDIDLIITDLQMPRVDGAELLASLRRMPAAPPAIVITAHGDERAAVEMLQLGAADYFPKPFEEAEILRVVERHIGTAEVTTRLRHALASRALSQHMIFESSAMFRVAEVVQRVAPRDVSVLITGESGTGKELVARSIVAQSSRATEPFVPVNCAALPEGLVESEFFGHARGAFTGAERATSGLFRQACGGTLFLDEIGDLSPQSQGALLRVLQERRVRPVGATEDVPVDVRVLAATHRDLATLTSFRRDLFFRLNVVQIRLPSLRTRPEDIVPLARHFASRAADRYGLDDVRLSASVEAQLAAQPWPGNVRELRHTVESLVALTDDAVIDHAAWEMLEGRVTRGGERSSLKAQVDLFERGLLEATLRECMGNQSEAARRLKVSRLTLSSKLKKHGLR